MNPTDRNAYLRLRELFERCVDMAPGERDNWFDREGIGTTARIELELMLAADANANDMLQHDVVELIGKFGDDADAVDPGRLIGLRYGAFRLKRLIGSGGQGTVYEGERVDGEFAQAVAVKLLRRGIHDPTEFRRFRRERDILARLDHPGIARLIDGGVSAEGVPYLIMELVDGEPLDRWCEQHAQDIGARLALFERLCEIVQAAHRMLIVHRDLKPANVLVGTNGAVKVLDFGIARLLDEDDAQERTIVPMMTPGYCAPEQRDGGQLTLATDVHALGVILRQLLTGQTPVTGKSVRQSPVTNPSLPAELQWIVAKACDSEPTRRYRDATDLLDDLVRYRRAQPLHAHPPSRIYAARKFVHRHRGGVLATMLFLIGVLASAGVALWQAKVAREQAQRAEATRDFLLGIFETARQDSPRETRPTPEVLVRTAAKKLDGDSSLTPELRGEFLGTLSAISYSSSDYATAVEQAEHALQVLQSAGLQDSRQALALTLRRANALISLNRAAEADQILGANLAQLRAVADKTAVEGLSSASAARFGNGKVDDAIALAGEAAQLAERVFGKDSQDTLEVELNHGDLLVVAGRSREGAASLEKTLERWRAAGIAQDSDFANSLQSLAEAKYRLGDLAASGRAQREALTLLQRIYTAPHEKIADALFSLAVPLMNEDRNDEAEQVLLDAAQMYSALFPPLHPQNAGMLDGLGSFELKRQNYPKAAGYFERATRICIEGKLDRNPDCARFWQNLSYTYLKLDRIDDAAQANAHSLELRRSLFGEHHASYASSLGGLAGVQLARKQPTAALATIDQALAILAEHGQSESIGATMLLRTRARALKDLSRPAEALEILDRLVALLDRLVPDDTEHHLNALSLRAETLEVLGRTDDARKAARAALKFERQRALISPERWQHLKALAR